MWSQAVTARGRADGKVVRTSLGLLGSATQTCTIVGEFIHLPMPQFLPVNQGQKNSLCSESVGDFGESAQ